MELTEAVKEIQAIGKEQKDLVSKAIAEVEAVKKQGGDYEAKYKELDTLVQKNQEKIEKAQSDLLEMAKKYGRPEMAANGVVQKSLGEQLEENLTKHKDDLAGLHARNTGQKVSFVTKAVGTITMANHTGGVMALTTWDNEVARPERRTPQLRQLVRVLPVGSMYVAWAEKNGFGEGGADTVAETVKKPQKDLDFVEASKKVEKIAIFYKASKESLADIPGMRAEINADGVEEVNLKLDQQLFNGNGTAPNLSGIMSYAPVMATVPAPLALGVDRATNYDVIFAAATVIENTDFFTPNVAIVNPLDYAHMMMLKDPTTGAYLAPPSFAAGDRIGPVRVIPNPLMPQGEFLVGDFNRAVLRIREELNVQIGYENDDFTRNLVTILMEMRAVHYIKSNHINAFRKGVFATVRAALETV